MTVDTWESREDYEEFLRVHKDEYEVLEKLGEELTLKENPVAWYESVREGKQS